MTRYQHWSLPSSNLDVFLPSYNESKPRSILRPLQDKALDLFFVRYRKKDYPMVLIVYINIWGWRFNLWHSWGYIRLLVDFGIVSLIVEINLLFVA